MRILTLTALAFAGLATAASAAPLDCTAFLTGQWSGKGDYTMMGQTMHLDNTYTLNADGTFHTINRYTDSEDKWQEQAMNGTWTAVPGTGENDCTVTMEAVFDAETTGGATGTSSSTSTYTRIDDDTLSSMDFPMKRVAP